MIGNSTNEQKEGEEIERWPLCSGVTSLSAPEPGMSERSVGAEPGPGLPVQTLSDEVHHQQVRVPPHEAAQHHGDVTGGGRASPLLRGRVARQQVAGTARGHGEEPRAPGGIHHEAGRRHPKHLNHKSHLIILVVSGEEGVAQDELGEDAAQAPHVNLDSIVTAKDDLRRSVKPTLNVIMELPLCVTTRPEVNHLESRFPWLSEQNVLRFEITVDNLIPFQQTERD